MGIFIYGEISKSVTRDEWERVYEETLVLVHAFPFAERGTVTYTGREVVCAVPSKEQETVSYWGDKRTGWSASMDYNTLRWAEEYYLPRDLIGENEADVKAGDAIMGMLSSYLDYDEEDERFGHAYSIWGDKTQGEPYHIYLLAVACLIEDRLGEKAFVYGDITLGQCRKAVELANQYLEKSIHIPARCEMERFYRRIRELPLEEAEKLEIFERLYLGVQDESFYAFVRSHFPMSIMLERWKERFSKSNIGTRGFAQNLKKYLKSGLGLEELCHIVDMKDEEGDAKYEEFIVSIMDSKLHLKEKNTEDYLEISPEWEQPYGIETLFADFLFGSAHNPKVERYIPIEEIREELAKGMGMKCDVNKYIDEYLEKEAASLKIDILNPDMSEEELLEMAHADASEVFMQFMDKNRDALQNQQEQYDISNYGDLAGYKRGNTVAPGLMESIGRSFQVYHGALEEDRYKELMAQSSQERCLYLIEQNQSLLLRDRDWIQIFSDIEKNLEIYERYYPMVRVKISSTELSQMVRAFVLNDELYDYAQELSKIYE